MIKAIETKYKGYKFRSRLEARWAVFFDALGIKWEYEKEGFDLEEAGWYLPDFWLPDKQVWVEVKPRAPSESEGEKMRLLVAGTECYGGIFLTNIPESINDLRIERKAYEKNEPGYSAFQSDVPIEAKDAYLGFGEPEAIFKEKSFRHVECPVCGGEYVHFGAPIYQETDDYDAWEGRGSAIRIPMWCELEWHSWEVIFGFHKGYTFTRIENLTVMSDCLMTWLADGNQELVLTSLVAARSARFETR